MFARISLLFSLFCLASLAHAQDRYSTYRNARFGTTVQYPANLVTPQPEADNGDGRKFVSRDGHIELTVYGSNNALADSLRGAMTRSINQWRGEGGRLTYQKIGPGYFALSGFLGDDIFYEKTLLRGAVFHTLLWQYPQTERKRLDEPVTRSVRTFAALAGWGTTAQSAKMPPKKAAPITRAVATRPTPTRAAPSRSATARRPANSQRASTPATRGY